MPKLIQRFECEYCQKDNFTTYEACLQHELEEHVHISKETFEEWKELKHEVLTAGYIVSQTKNEKTDAAFEEAVNKILAFEKKYKISDQSPIYKHLC